MIALHRLIIVPTHGKGTYEITQMVQEVVRQSLIQTGVAVVFIRHTSASLITYENADPTAREDLHAYFDRMAPEENPNLVHTVEGPDDSTGHLRAALTRTSEALPIVCGKLALGRWQGIFVFEHRKTTHSRTVDIAAIGT
ncbi:MAG: YjbQ family protein [Candidatus Xiphinematobacter sp.]|nr:MAG: YjbQ family protein [Candidatus Xiphinematobacter sp.]